MGFTDGFRERGSTPMELGVESAPPNPMDAQMKERAIRKGRKGIR